jgi:hypothetical protein
LIHGQLDKIASETNGSGLVQALFLEILCLGHCAGTSHQFEQWIASMQARGSDLAVKELKDNEKRCTDKSLFAPGAAWPIFI